MLEAPWPPVKGYTENLTNFTRGKVERRRKTLHHAGALPASPTLVLDPVDPDVQYVLMPLRV